MRLELADGQVVDVKDTGAIEKALKGLGPDKDFAILGDDSFVQAAWSDGKFLAEYRTGGGYFRSVREDLSLDEITSLFNGFFSNDGSWKEGITWTSAEENRQQGGQENREGAGPQRGFKDDIAEQLKRDALNWGKKKLKRFLKF